MKVIYMGSPEFSVFGLKAIENSGHEVVAVVSRPDKIRGRKKILSPTPLKAYAIEKGHPVYTPDNVNNPDFLEELKSLGGDVLVVSAFGSILKAPLLNLLPFGAVNIHGSLLPLYRGASPMNAVLRDGKEDSGITIIYMDEGMDEGDILLQEGIPIPENQIYDEFRDNMGLLGGRLIVKALDELASGTASRTPQNHKNATYCSLLTRDDEKIDWSEDGATIHNKVRSLSTEPCAFTFLNQQVFKIGRTLFTEGSQKLPVGSVIGAEKGKGVAVAVKNGTLYLKNVKPQGKKMMDAIAWFNGLRQENIVFTTEME